jgi:hypothetical protein
MLSNKYIKIRLLKSGALQAGLFLDYQNQKSGNWDKKPLNVFSWVKLNTTRVIGS